jgi:hypothetical protein
MQPSPAAQYSLRRARAEAQLQRLDRRGALLANVRGTLFLAVVALVALPLFGKLPRSAWGYAAGAAVLYGIAAVIHARLLEAEDRARLCKEVNERALGRLDGGWRTHPRRGEQLLNEGDLASGDLDLFGPASLFQLVTEAVTRQGEERLGFLLTTGSTSVAEVTARQEAVQDLTGRIDFRQAFAVEAQRAVKLGTDGRPFLRWTEGPSLLASIAWTQLPALLLPLITLTLYVLGRLELLPRSAYAPALLLHLALIAVTFGPLSNVYAQLAPGERGFVRLGGAFAQLEAEAFSAAYLVQLCSGFRPAGGLPISARLTRLERLFSLVEIRQSGLVHGLLHFFTLWDVHAFFALERWRRREGTQVRAWMEALAELEALFSLAAFAHARPHLPYPQLREEGPRVRAKALAHPLLEGAVANDVELADPGTALIVTGSNMSGKSTLLRALGVNAVLARAGTPVSAASLEMALLRVVTSMRVKDSLERGVSYFYAEVQRLKAVLDAAQEKGGRVLFLLDEILLGTNTRERQVASREVLKRLLATGAVGAVTTHDLSLTTLEGEVPHVRNVHFQDSLQDGELRFDYQLRGGVVQTTNALRVLAQAGIVIPEA